MQQGAFYLAQHHGGNLLRRESLVLTKVLDLHLRIAIIVDDFEWPRLDVLLDRWVVESSTDEAPTPALGTVRRY